MTDRRAGGRPEHPLSQDLRMILFAMLRAQMLCVSGESLRDAVDQPAPNDPAETQK